MTAPLKTLEANVAVIMPEIGQRARAAARVLALATRTQKDKALAAMAQAMRVGNDTILAANAEDMAYFSCRGYVSQSEMWGASARLLRCLSNGQKPVIIYLGDHDPSGIDMTRDIRDRLTLFMGPKVARPTTAQLRPNSREGFSWPCTPNS